MAYKPNLAMRSCGHCGLRRAQFQTVGTDVKILRSNGSIRWFSILACPDCAGLTVVETYDETMTGVMQSWPERPEARASVDHLPADVARYYADAQRVLDVGVPDAAAVQLRRTLEAAAAHHDQDQRVLVQRIQALIDAGLVTRPFGEALDLIRKVGNQGAHASDEHVDQASAERALRFTTQLLRNLFEVPEELRLARAEANAGDGGPQDGVSTTSGDE
ncbi:DUF4145 domain-containing protein [Cellulomonas sp. S1-8]|uniref:DUF4145 domain-containing protein n=1 Tax=Cellulomonas sp. S1-8 TaxID=2904790 RepID=UPI002243AF50|nr:DUF4145 domain-containing protein [Cellulomonas sp. S1-8]UZN03302.1 DUF4145 domain-containing protein [Cellulomonas sp. S1-8]